MNENPTPRSQAFGPLIDGNPVDDLLVDLPSNRIRDLLIVLATPKP